MFRGVKPSIRSNEQCRFLPSLVRSETRPVQTVRFRPTAALAFRGTVLASTDASTGERHRQMEANMEFLSVVCAWCKRIVTAAPEGTPVTHTICTACFDRTMTHPRRDPPDEAAPPSPDHFGDVFKP